MDLMGFCDGFDLGQTLQGDFDLYLTVAKYQWEKRDKIKKKSDDLKRELAEKKVGIKFRSWKIIKIKLRI